VRERERVKERDDNTTAKKRKDEYGSEEAGIERERDNGAKYIREEY
jgi:hypothetical protein